MGCAPTPTLKQKSRHLAIDHIYTCPSQLTRSHIMSTRSSNQALHILDTAVKFNASNEAVCESYTMIW